MPRGGRDKDREGGLPRRCIATGDSAPREGLVRFVLAPDGTPVPDLAERLPGRGAWVGARREALDRAVKKNLFARAFRQPVQVPEGLAARVEALLVQRLIESLGLARRAGLAVCGFEKVRFVLAGPAAAALFAAIDGAEGGKSKVRSGMEAIPVFEVLDSRELGLAFGRETVIHAALETGGATERVIREAMRLSGFRTGNARV